jgi:hypothetical protein
LWTFNTFRQSISIFSNWKIKRTLLPNIQSLRATLSKPDRPSSTCTIFTEAGRAVRAQTARYFSASFTRCGKCKEQAEFIHP